MSPSLSRVASAGEIAALRRKVAAMPFRTFVLVVPRFDDEPGVETLDALPSLVRDRIGIDGLYIVSDGSGIGLEAQALGVRTRGDVRRVSIVASDAVPRHEGPIARIGFALDHLRTGAVATRSVDAEEAADDARPWWIFGGAVLLGLVVPLGLAAVTPGARSRRVARRQERERTARDRRATAGSVSPTPVRGAARRTAQEQTAALARAIAESPDPPDGALRLYDAASSVLGRPSTRPIDFVGAEALATAGRAALDGDRWRPCFFDPRHGEGTRSTRWRRGAQEVPLPACEDCADRIARGAVPASLPDDGEPYWSRDSIWARTGFGAIDERVADAVLAGERRT